METIIKKQPKELIEEFLAIKSRTDLCIFLGIEEKTLIYLLYRNRTNNYKEFEIPKKSGGIRKIKAPISTIKIIQRKISDTLYTYITNHKSAHGFVYYKSIKTNAEAHTKKKYVFNLDLEHFFDSINFGRVRGLFLSNPFNFNEITATLLAQICCDNGSLPQGAPTSPIISNLICLKLDKKLFNLARESYANYTRYADDITFSFNSGGVYKNLINKLSDTLVSEKLKSIIEDNGFTINFKKVRLSNSSFERQKVTGIVVNQKVNLERRYIKKMRAILFCWEKSDVSKAATIFFQNNIPTTSKGSMEEKFIKTLRGRLDFIKQIKGDCFVWRKLINKYNFLLKNGLPPMPISKKEEIEMASWVIEGGDQGTGFCAKDEKGIKYFITCAHTLNGDNIELIRPKDSKKAKLDIIKKDDHKDVAICQIKDIDEIHLWYLNIKTSHTIDSGEIITISGYPQYGPGQKIRTEEAQVTGAAVNSLVDLFRTNGSIISGNSGGAILNKNNEVIGIATYDKTCILGESAFLPIETIYEL